MTGLTYEVAENGDLRVSFAGTHQERADQQSGLLAERSNMDALCGLEDSFCTDENMHEVFERLTGNSELEWVRPEYTGCLTDAPMLGIYGEDVPITPELERASKEGYLEVSGHWDDTSWYRPVVKAWAFMDYQITSPQDKLAECGIVTFKKAM